jgi:hypothetical protein
MSEAFRSFVSVIDRRFNYIFIAKDGIAEKSFFEIKDMIYSCIKKAGLFNELDC